MCDEMKDREREQMRKNRRVITAIVGTMFALVLIFCREDSLSRVHAASFGSTEGTLIQLDVSDTTELKNAISVCVESPYDTIEVTLTDNIDLSSANTDEIVDTFTLNGGNLIINFSGYTISGALEKPVFSLESGNLELKDDAGTGGIYNSGAKGIVIDANGGTLKISGGNFMAPRYIALNLNNTTAEISGGSFSGGFVALEIGESSNVTISGNAEFSSEERAVYVTSKEKGSVLIIQGGTFNGNAKDSYSYACSFEGANNILKISGGTFNLNSPEGSSLVIGTDVPDDNVSISGGIFNGRIARMISGEVGWDYRIYYGEEGISSSGIISDGYVLTDNTFKDNGEPTVFSADYVEVKAGYLITFDTRRSQLETYDSEVAATEADLYSLTPVSVGTGDTVHVYGDGNVVPTVDADKVSDGNVYEFYGWHDADGREYGSVNAYAAAQGLTGTDTVLTADWRAEVNTSSGLSQAISNVKVIELTEDISLDTSLTAELTDDYADGREKILNLAGNTIRYDVDEAADPALVLMGTWRVKDGTIESRGQACLQFDGTAMIENLKCRAENASYVVGFSNVTDVSESRIISGTFETTASDGQVLWAVNGSETGMGDAEDITNLFLGAYASSTTTRIDGENVYLDAKKLIVSQTPITYAEESEAVEMGTYIYGETVSGQTLTFSNAAYMGDIVITGVSVDNSVFEVTAESAGKTLTGGGEETYSYAVGATENPIPGNYEGTVSINYTRMDGTTGACRQSVTLVVTPKQLTITEPNLIKTKDYDGMTTARVTAGELQGVIPGDDVSVTAAAEYDNAEAGEGKTITVRYTLTGADKENYLAPADNACNDGSIRDNRITFSTVIRLIRGKLYRLSSGRWTVDGDNTVYNGDISFYVLEEGDFTFRKW